MDLLRRMFKKDENEKPRLSGNFVIIIVCFAIIFLVFNGNTFKGRTEIETSYENQIKSEPDGSIFATEKRLEEILEKIEGAGDVSVMIYYNSLGEKIIASDNKTRSEKKERGDGLYDVAEDEQKQAVLYGQGSDKKPFVTEEKLPEPDGILIIAEGAKNEKVRYEISEAVRALLGLPRNRIRVSAKIKS